MSQWLVQEAKRSRCSGEAPVREWPNQMRMGNPWPLVMGSDS